MSGICGIFYRDGRQVESQTIKNMNSKISHRGPDGSKVWVKGPVALGHQMLHTTPESLHEKLPWEDRSSGLVITADARIDNRDELAPLLGIENSINIPDSVFILKTYEKWGDSCPGYLLGDFSFAIWDPVNEILFCARDHMGVKPFYYYISDDVFYFATEMKSIFTISNVPKKLNELKVAYHLIQMLLEKKMTFYENIFNLPAAHSIKINDNEHEIKEYWILDPKLKVKIDSDLDYINKFSEIFRESVKCRLRSKYPIGFELSGGLDSSSVVGMAKKIINQTNTQSNDINTFSYIYKEIPDIDESYYIGKIVDMGDISSNVIYGDNTGPLKDMRTILWNQEQPFSTLFMSILWDLYQEMQKKNIRVVLNGEGGDGIGYNGRYYLKELFFKLKWKRMIEEIEFLSKHHNKSFLKIFMNQILLTSLPYSTKKGIKILLSKDSKEFNILNKEFASKYGGEQHLKNISKNYLESAKTPLKYHYEILTGIMRLHEIRDKIGGMFSIEPRYPFLDKRLVEYAYAVPTEIKFRNGWDRYLYRVAMTGIIPKENQWRPFKFNVRQLYQKNLLFFEKNYLEEMLNDDEGIGQYTDLKAMKHVYEDCKSGNESNDIIYLWLMMVLDFWLQNNDLIQVKGYPNKFFIQD